jgi:hypothetical protein
VLSGCASLGVFQPAETLGRKNWDLAVELSSQAQTSFDSLSLYPMSAVSFRYGVAEGVDLGLRFGPGGVEVLSKFMLTSRGAPVIVSVAPSVAGTFSVPAGIVIGSSQVSLPVLIGIPLGERLELVLAPKVHDSVFGLGAGQAGGVVNQLFVGGAVGVVVRLGRFKIIPDVGFLGPALATTTWRSDLPPGTAWAQGRWTFQANVTVTLGKAAR